MKVYLMFEIESSPEHMGMQDANIEAWSLVSRMEECAPMVATTTCRLFGVGLTALACLGIGGCQSEETETLDAYIEELEFGTSLEVVDEVELGTYRVAGAVTAEEGISRDSRPAWVHMRFKLFAIVEPQHESAVRAECQRHRGLIDDAVITVCRETSIEELVDSRWATLKSRMVDAIRPILGEEKVKQVALDDFSWEPI